MAIQRTPLRSTIESANGYLALAAAVSFLLLGSPSHAQQAGPPLAQRNAVAEVGSTLEARLQALRDAAEQGESSVAKTAQGLVVGAISSTVTGLNALVEKRSELVLSALSLLGVNYKFGGNSPETGLDCSGLVRLVFNQALGLVLPRRSEEISKATSMVRQQDLQPGDLVFFNTLKKAFSHVGIYIGNGQFIHAPSSGKAVRIENMDKPYWQERFDGARRVAQDKSLD